MSARIDTIGFNELASTLRILGGAGGTVDDADWLRSPGNASDVIAFIRDRRGHSTSRPGTNPFALSVDELLSRLRQADIAQGWGITEDEFTQLRDHAPALPKGRRAFLSFRIRFDAGQKGVEQTANAHIKEILRVHGKKNVWRWDNLRTDEKHLRLLVGNKTHKPVVEWCVIDLDTHRKRDSITSVRGSKSLADEGLVLAWLVPDRVRSIDYKEWCAWFCAGYESNVPGDGDGPWRRVPCVHRYLYDGSVGLGAGWRSAASSGCSVPSVG